MTPRSEQRIDPRLCLMMFLQYATIGIRAPLLPSYLSADVAEGGLGFSGYQIGWILAIAPAIGSMAAPFIAGQFADRYFAGERYLAVALLFTAATQWVLSYQESFPAWAVLSVIFSIGFYPTVGLTNALAMANLPSPQRQFARVRMWGTVGWVFVGWTFPMLFLQESLQPQWFPPFFGGPTRPDATARIAMSLQASAGIALGYALFCLFLPHTPPNRSAPDRFAFVAAFRLLKRRSVVVLILVSLILSALDRIVMMQTAPYLQSIGIPTSQVMPTMAIAQMSEIVMMFFLGIMLARFGFRSVIGLGTVCYLVRFGIFSVPDLPTSVIVSSQVLHGTCFACAFTAAAIYVDRISPQDARHSVQTGFTLASLAPGAILGGLVNGLLSSLYTEGDATNFAGLWFACAELSLLAIFGLVVFFRDESA